MGVGVGVASAVGVAVGVGVGVSVGSGVGVSVGSGVGVGVGVGVSVGSGVGVSVGAGVGVAVSPGARVGAAVASSPGVASGEPVPSSGALVSVAAFSVGFGSAGSAGTHPASMARTITAKIKYKKNLRFFNIFNLLIASRFSCNSNQLTGRKNNCEIAFKKLLLIASPQASLKKTGQLDKHLIHRSAGGIL